jgi:quinol monooxygenase YgiN
MTTTLDAKAGYVVIINIFTVDPDRAEDLLSVLIKSTQRVSKRPGFISANWHIAKDKKHVTNYAQWRNQADIDGMLADPVIQTDLKEAAAIATRIEPIAYELRATLAP